MARKRAENREGSLGCPGFVKPVFTIKSKPLGKRKRSLGYLGSVTPVLTLRSVTLGPRSSRPHTTFMGSLVDDSSESNKLESCFLGTKLER
ncbi:hypothetical protein TNCV_2530651 [Trichonephila clavipes]|nr:hypothetical protein TNCV_2530651 [Trichonephila clavipes]